jgi:hypothetical protein
LGSDETVGYQK